MTCKYFKKLLTLKGKPIDFVSMNLPLFKRFMKAPTATMCFPSMTHTYLYVFELNISHISTKSTKNADESGVNR